MQLKSIAKSVKRPFRVFKVFSPKTKSKRQESSAPSVVIEHGSDVKPITVDLAPSRSSDVRENEQKHAANTQAETTAQNTMQNATQPKEQEAKVPESVTEDTQSHGSASQPSQASNAVTEPAHELLVPTLHIVEPTPASSPAPSAPPSPVAVTASVVEEPVSEASRDDSKANSSEEPAKPDSVEPVELTKGSDLKESMDTATSDEQLPSAPPDNASNHQNAIPEVGALSPQPSASVASPERPAESSLSPSKDESETADINPFIIDDAELSPTDHERPATPPTLSPSPEPALKDTPSPSSDEHLTSSESSFPETPLTPRAGDIKAELPPIPVDVNKDVPASPTPAPEPEQEVEEPVVVAPALALSSMFLPIPNTDPLTSLLIKHVPEVIKRPTRDVSGEWQHSDFNTLVMTNNWRALARMARDRIVASNPTEIHAILGFWYVRLSSLARMRLFNQCTAECDNLFTALAGISPPQSRTYVFERVLPFELEVMRARCVYWSGDPIGYLDELSALHRRCRVKARMSKNEDEVGMWKERGARMCLIIASQLVEMKDFCAAASFLEPLCAGKSGTSALRSAVARIYLQGGFIAAAARHISIVDQDPDADVNTKVMNQMLLAAANGDWGKSGDLAEQLFEQETDSVTAVNNYAVALLSQGRVKEAIEKMEYVLHDSPAAVTTAEPFLFNFATLYELRSSIAVSKKRDLLVEVAKWSGDGLKASCLKMPS